MDIRLFFASPETEQELAIQRLVDTVSNQTPSEIHKMARICGILIKEGVEIP
jgi:hypothetical protein